MKGKTEPEVIYAIAGRAVKLAETRGVALPDLSEADWASLSEQIGGDVAEIFDFAAAVARRSALGGTGEQMGQLQRARLWLGARQAAPQA